MGGSGSGLYGQGGGKTAVEHCRSIDIRRWQRDDLLSGSGFGWSWMNNNGEMKAAIEVITEDTHLTLSYSANSDPVETKIYYDETTTGFGKRKWFLCPTCGDRCAVLYLKSKHFACRKCQDLNYRSSQLSGEMDYYHEQLIKLCKVLKAAYEPTRMYPPWKPKGMHWATYEKLAKRYRRLAIERDQAFITEAQMVLNRL